jgi:hypothetical protein
MWLRLALFVAAVSVAIVLFFGPRRAPRLDRALRER